MKKRLFLGISVSLLLLSILFTALTINFNTTQAAYPWPTVGNKDSGENVRTIQYLLRYRGHSVTVDGQYGPQTLNAVKSFQSKSGLKPVDGIVGPLTWPKLVVTLKSPSKNEAVTALQRQLNAHGISLTVDGDFGPKTKSAVISYQSKNGISPANGTADAATWSKLVNSKTVTPPPSTTKLRDINSFGKTIEGYASYQKQTTCDPKAKPGVTAFMNMILKAFPDSGSYGITRACGGSDTSEHKEGRAWDWKVNVKNAKQKAEVEQVLNWLFATDKYGHKHAMIRRLGIMYIIWDGKIWGSYRASEGWRAYSGPSEHTDHVHFSFSHAGANKTTSFWK